MRRQLTLEGNPNIQSKFLMHFVVYQVLFKVDIILML